MSDIKPILISHDSMFYEYKSHSPSNNPYLRDALQYDFYLRPLDQGQCSNYYILFWTPDYLLTQISYEDTITRDGIEYKITTDLSKLAIPFTCYGKFYLKISFRRNKYDESQAYCLIRQSNKRIRKS